MAGVEIGTAILQLQPSAKGMSGNIRKELGGAGRQAGEDFGDEFNKAASNSGKGLDAFGTKALIGAAAVGAGFYGLASAAGDLDAALAANIQVLGDASDAVQDFAKSGVENVGLSETAVLNAATAFGQLGKIAGLTGSDLSGFSTDMVTLAADLAAFANVPASQAVDDLRAAFSGSTETMQKYNVFLNETELKSALFRATGERVTGVLTSQQRVLATHAALMEQTGDIQGQAAREADSFQRAQDNLIATVQNAAADFGAPIVGFATDLLGLVSGGLAQVQEWNEATGGMLATGIAAGLGLSAVLGGLAGGASKVRDAAKWFGELNGRWKAGIGVAGGLSLAIAAGFTAYGLMTAHSRKLAAQTKAAGSALDSATTEAWEYAEATSAASGDVDGLAVAQQALGTAVLSTFDELDPEMLGALGIQASELGEELINLREDPLTALTALGQQAGLTAGDAELLAVVLDRFAETDNDFVTEGDSLSTYLRELGGDFNFTKEEADAFAERAGAVGANLEDVWDAAQSMDMDEIASQFLNAKVATSEEAEALVQEAEARAEASRNGEGAYDVYVALNEILAEMTPAERDAAQAALGLADAQSQAAESSTEVESVAASTVDTMSDAEDAFQNAADAASAFDEAIQRLVGQHLDHQEAMDEVQAGYDELAEQILRAQANEEGYSLSLSKNTKEGRENRAMIRDQVESILGMAQSQLEVSGSVDAASAALNGQRDELIRLITPFFETEEAAAAYIDRLGLTPESIDTAVNLYNEEQAKSKVEAWLAELDDIPASEATSIQAYIDEGAYSAALKRLEILTQPRYADIRATVSRASRGVTYGEQAASGALASTPTRVTYGHGLEWIAPLEKPNEMERWLQDARIRNPVMDALDMEPTVVGVGRGDSRPFQFISYEQNPTPATVSTAMRMARMS